MKIYSDKRYGDTPTRFIAHVLRSLEKARRVQVSTYAGLISNNFMQRDNKDICLRYLRSIVQVSNCS